MGTNAQDRLDEVHSALTTLIEEGRTAQVLYTIASVLGTIPELDMPANDDAYWRSVIFNLNTLGDDLASGDEDDAQHWPLEYYDEDDSE